MTKSEEPVVPPELLKAKEAAVLAGVGTRSWWRFVSSGAAPSPVHIGRCSRWRRQDIKTWIDNGCPSVRKEVRR
jgi:predicted DNA-binding transcriptional regulator AlpA